MRFLRQGLSVLLLACIIFGVHGQQCVHYQQDGGICTNYKSNNDYVFYDKGVNVADLEKSFGSLASAQGLLTLSGEPYLTNCTQAFTSYVCATAFPECNTTSTSIIPPCLSNCLNVVKSCKNNIELAPPETQLVIANYIYPSKLYPQDCAGNVPTTPPLDFLFPTNSCNTSPQLYKYPKCFKPLVVDDKWVETNGKQVSDVNYCQKGCCLPCPQPYGLYQKNQMEGGFLATQILRALSAIGSGIILVLYMILPGRRTHPSTLILFTSLTIFLYSSNVFFSIFNPKIVQCENEITPSTQSNNKFFCGFQGALLIFSSIATAMWVGFIILNLHVHTVWNSNIMKDKYLYLNIIGWGVPVIITIIALGTGSVSYQFATLCLIKVEMSDLLFFYPLAIIVVPSFFIHMSTFIYIYRISRKESKEENKESEFMTNRFHVLQAIKIQWRSLLLAIILLFTIICYWLFYYVELSKISGATNNEKFLEDWTLCIQSGKGQNYCSKEVSSKFMPPFTLLLLAEISTSLIGIYLVLIFFNHALWEELKQWINTKFRPIQNEFLAI